MGLYEVTVAKQFMLLKLKPFQKVLRTQYSLPFKYSVGLYGGRRRPLVGVNPTAALIRIY